MHDTYVNVSLKAKVDEETFYQNVDKRELARSIMKPPMEMSYPYRIEKKLIGGKINHIKLIPYELQRTYVLVAVTSEMYFYGGEAKQRKCPGCREYLDRYSHIQW